MSFDASVIGRPVNITELEKMVARVHSLFQISLTRNRQRERQSPSSGILAYFDVGAYVLVAREDFNAGEKSLVCCQGPRCIKKTINYYFFRGRSQ